MGRLLDFLEDRLGLASLWRDSMPHKRPPRGIGYLRTLGFAALTVLVLQLLSGVGLAFHYVPATDLAYDSIRAMEKDVPWGRFVRALHHFGASAFVILLALHLCRVFFTGAYKRPREFTWLTGVGLLLVVLGFGFTGYLLPWDQKAYFATKVGTEIAGKAPLLGEHLRIALNGGESVGPPTLTRFYVIHVVLLPLALLGLLGLHLFLIQKHGVTPPGLPVEDPGQPGEPYFPHHTFKEAVVGAGVTLVLFVLAFGWNAPLEALAEPAETGYDPRPDWYFLGLFQLLKIFKGPLESVGTFWLPNLFIIGLLLLPFLDRSPHRHWRRRPLVTGLGICTLVVMCALTWMGARDAPDNDPVVPYPIGYTDAEKRGYILVRRLKCTECHKYEMDGVTYGESKHDAPDLNDIDFQPQEVSDILVEPPVEEMPVFDHVPYEDRIAIGIYLRRIFKK